MIIWARLGVGYVVTVEAQLQSEVLALVQGVLGALEIHMPQLQVIGRQYGLDLCILLNGFELLL